MKPSLMKNECNHPRKEIRDWEVLFVGLVVNQVLFWEMKVVNQFEWLGKTHSTPLKDAKPSWAMHKGAYYVHTIFRAV